jgi:hypothetical protein
VASHGFTQILNDFIRSESLSPKAKLVGMAMASHANSSRLTWPGLTILRRETGLGRDAIYSGRHELIQKGYLVLVQERSARGMFGRTKYEVTAKLLLRRITEKP